jgi:hypothetical protein
MKKKLIALLTVTVLVLGCSMTAFAAESPEAADAETDAEILNSGSIKAKSGDTEFSIAPANEEILTSAKEAVKKLVKGDTTLLKVFSIELPQGVTLDTVNGTPITIEVEGIEAGQKISVLHQKDDGTWEEVKVTKVETGKVTALFKSLSPVAIVKKAKSNKTGEVFSYAGIICLLALAGAAYCTKKYALE